MRLDCPNCGAKGDSRKTKTPRWRCSPARSNGGCGYEWDDPNYNDPGIDYKVSDKYQLDQIRLMGGGGGKKHDDGIIESMMIGGGGK